MFIIRNHILRLGKFSDYLPNALIVNKRIQPSDKLLLTLAFAFFLILSRSPQLHSSSICMCYLLKLESLKSVMGIGPLGIWDRSVKMFLSDSISPPYRYLINCNYTAIPVPRERVRETCMAIFGYFGRFRYSL